jgi:DNA repair exonuclease SbcCD ATPase subunit
MILKLEHIGKIDTATFNFSQGVTTVIGRNGQGKSTLVNALYMALTGETIDGCNLDDKVTWGYDTGNIFLITDHWKVTRTIGKKSAVLLEDKSGVRFTKKAEVNDYILRWYNIPSEDILKEVYFSAQYKAIDILETTPAKRLDMFATVLGFAKYKKADQLLYQHISSMPVIQYNDTLYDNFKQSLADDEALLPKLKQELDKLNQSFEKFRSPNELYKIINAPTESSMNNIKNELIKAEQDLENETVKLQFLQDEKARKLSIKNKLQQYDNYIADKKELDKLIHEMQGIEANMPNATEKIRELIEEDTKSKTEFELRLKTIESQKDMLKDGLCPLSKAPPCSTLLSILDPAKLEEESKEINKNLNIINENLDAMKAMLKMSEDATAAFIANDSRQAIIKARLMLVTDDIKNYQDTTDRIELANYSEIEANKEIIEQEKVVGCTRDMVTALKCQIAVDIVTDEERANAIREEDERNLVTSEIISLKRDIKTIEDRMPVTKSQIAKMEEDKAIADEHNFKRNVYACARHILNRDNLPRMLMENAITQLNTHLTYYINLFNFPYKCQVFADGTFMYASDKDEWHSTKLLSGGQKYMVAIMLKLALAAVLKTSFPFYVLDEPTTGLDTENRRLLADLFRDMEAKINPLYLIIPTHDVEIADSASNTITIGD